MKNTHNQRTYILCWLQLCQFFIAYCHFSAIPLFSPYSFS